MCQCVCMSLCNAGGGSGLLPLFFHAAHVAQGQPLANCVFPPRGPPHWESSHGRSCAALSAGMASTSMRWGSLGETSWRASCLRCQVSWRVKPQQKQALPTLCALIPRVHTPPCLGQPVHWAACLHLLAEVSLWALRRWSVLSSFACRAPPLPFAVLLLGRAHAHTSMRTLPCAHARAPSRPHSHAGMPALMPPTTAPLSPQMHQHRRSFSTHAHMHLRTPKCAL